MPFSVRFGVCLVYLTILLILPEQGRPQCNRITPRFHGAVAPTCCLKVSEARIGQRITSCVEQNTTTLPLCKIHAFIFTTVNKIKHCVDPGATWLTSRLQKLQQKGICCSS